MKFAIRGLKGGKGRKGRKVSSESGVDYALNDLRYEVEVGNRTVTGEIVGRQVVFFEQRRDERMFELLREGTFREGQVNNRSDLLKEDRKTGYE